MGQKGLRKWLAIVIVLVILLVVFLLWLPAGLFGPSAPAQKATFLYINETEHLLSVNSGYLEANISKTTGTTGSGRHGSLTIVEDEDLAYIVRKVSEPDMGKWSSIYSPYELDNVHHWIDSQGNTTSCEVAEKTDHYVRVACSDEKYASEFFNQTYEFWLNAPYYRTTVYPNTTLNKDYFIGVWRVGTRYFRSRMIDNQSFFDRQGSINRKSYDHYIFVSADMPGIYSLSYSWIDEVGDPIIYLWISDSDTGAEQLGKYEYYDDETDHLQGVTTIHTWFSKAFTLEKHRQNNREWYNSTIESPPEITGSGNKVKVKPQGRILPPMYVIEVPLSETGCQEIASVKGLRDGGYWTVYRLHSGERVLMFTTNSVISSKQSFRLACG